MRPKIWAVRMYPGGGVVCQKVALRDVMTMHEALKAMHDGHAICIPMDYVFVVRYVKSLPVKRTTLLGRELARLLLDGDSDLSGAELS